MINKNILAREALRAALNIRRKLRIPNNEPICVYDIAEKLNVEVKFVDIPSLEGMYAKASNTILLSTHRPPGRKTYTCGHELGHWYFNHGDCLDEDGNIANYKNSKPEEQIADLFSGFLIMPSWVIKYALNIRNYNFSSLTPIEAFRISNQLGVGYSALINHLHWSLGFITKMKLNNLLKITPKEIKSEELGFEYSGNLMIADQNWNSIPIDLSVDDYAILPHGIRMEGLGIEILSEGNGKTIILAKQPGIVRIECKRTLWSTFIRISRKYFTGRSIYRHLEE